MLAAALENLTEAEAKVIWEALNQYVDNTTDADEEPQIAAKISVATILLGRLDGAIAAGAT